LIEKQELYSIFTDISSFKKKDFNSESSNPKSPQNNDCTVFSENDHVEVRGKIVQTKEEGEGEPAPSCYGNYTRSPAL